MGFGRVRITIDVKNSLVTTFESLPKAVSKECFVNTRSSGEVLGKGYVSEVSESFEGEIVTRTLGIINASLHKKS